MNLSEWYREIAYKSIGSTYFYRCKIKVYIASSEFGILGMGVMHLFNVTRPEMINKTFRMPAELVEKLTKVAQTKKVSLNYLIVQCCQYALDNMSNGDVEQKK